MESDAMGLSVEEVERGKHECLALLKQLKEFHPIAEGEPYPSTYRLLVTPMLYSVWERYFTLCHAVGLRLIRESAGVARDLAATERAVWLLHTGFYQSLVSKLQSQI